MAYVDGYVIPVPKAQLERFRVVSLEMGKIWRELGALSYVECLGDDVPFDHPTSMLIAVDAKDDEIVAFSWIGFDSRDARDACTARVLADPRMAALLADPPYDARRSICGGFEVITSL